MKRWVIIITICILIGVLINVAVTWWCTIWGDSKSNSNPVSQSGFSFDESESREWYVKTDIGKGFTYSLSDTYDSQKTSSERKLTAEEVLPYWADSLRPDSDTEDNYTQGYLVALAHGWPFRSMMITGGTGIDSHSKYITGLSWKAPIWLVDRPTQPVYCANWINLPLKIIWPGFVANTLLYAMLLYSIFLLPLKLRFLLRLKRGQCTKCGYPIGQSEVCTECGTQLILKRQRL